MSEHQKIDYLEFPARDIPATKAFFTAAFGWTFQDYGPDYSSFADAGVTGAGVKGGFYKSDKAASRDGGSVLVVLYSENLEQTQASVEQAGGTIKVPIFAFPGGRRFHFLEPSGNELAVWSE